MSASTKLLMAAATAAVLTVGCDPQLAGEEGNLTLTYDKGATQGVSGSSPLAVGSKLTYMAHLSDDKDQKVSFTAATSDDDAVILVNDVSGGQMVLEGRGAGNATVDVDATGPDGDTLTDAFAMEAAEIDAVELEHPCARGEENGFKLAEQALYLVDHEIGLHYRMRADGTLAVGTGHYPVELAPQDAAQLSETSVNGLLPLLTGSQPGEVTISPTVDGDSFTIRLIEEGDIDGVTIFETTLFEQEATLSTSVGENLVLRLLPTVDGLLTDVEDPAPVCQSDITVDIDVATEQVCEVTYRPTEEHDGLFRLFEPNELAIDGLSEGDCEFSVTLPSANGGTGVSADFLVEIG